MVPAMIVAIRRARLVDAEEAEGEDVTRGFKKEALPGREGKSVLR